MAFKCTTPAVPTVQQDDDAVRITRWDFEPGAVTGWHQHSWPYFVVMLTDAILNVTTARTRTAFRSRLVSHIRVQPESSTM